MSDYQVADFLSLGLKTKRKDISDGRGIAFGWSAVPVIISGPDGEIEYVAEYNEKLDVIEIIARNGKRHY